MLGLIGKIWKYRSEIVLAVQLLAKLRRSAQEFTREYIRRKIRTKLQHSLLVVVAQIALLVVVGWWNAEFPSLGARLFASVVLWGVTLFNLGELLLVSLPELRALHRSMKTMTGYAVKYLLEISLVTEMMRLNVVFLIVCLLVGISSRTLLGMRFSYTKPWKQWLAGSSTDRPGLSRRNNRTGRK